MVIVDERMERLCRVNKVLDEGMERMVEKDGEMVQGEDGEESCG